MTDMEAGRELDTRIAIKVMGWTRVERSTTGIAYPPRPSGFDPARHAYHSVPHYSTDIAAAWLVVERMKDNGCSLQLHWEAGRSRQWVADFVEESDEEFTGEQLGDTAPLAICRAALAAVQP